MKPVIKKIEYVYTFDCVHVGCSAEQQLKREKIVEDFEKYNHTCWKCGAQYKVTLGADDASFEDVDVG